MEVVRIAVARDATPLGALGLDGAACGHARAVDALGVAHHPGTDLLQDGAGLLGEATRRVGAHIENKIAAL